MAIKEVLIPDLSGTVDADVIDVLVKVGDKIDKEDSLITLEGDKASMDVPSPDAGTVKEIKVKVGDKANENDLILTLETDTETTTEEKPTEKPPAKEQAKKAATATAEAQTQEVRIPDLGTPSDVEIIEIIVHPGDNINKEDPLVTLEGDKASMELPSPFSGEVQDIKVAVGDKVKEGDLILLMRVEGAEAAPAPAAKPAAVETKEVAKPAPVTPAAPATPAPISAGGEVHAGPAVRRLAREFGINLQLVKGTGRKNRIVKEDLQNYVKTALSGQGAPAAGGLTIEPAPKIDFAKFGDIETKDLTKIKRLTGVYTHRSWVTVPHVTQFEEADITDMEQFRQSKKAEAEKQGFKLTPLVFIMKAVVACLQEFPTFNSSLDVSGDHLILKKYFHIGIAADTPNGLVVPVIRDVDKKDVFQLAKELKEISTQAREKGLTPAQMQGGCMTVSSLGGIGGTAFTPIVNSPEVAILGVSKSQMKPVYKDGEFVPRLMLPLSLSYDHRVIDGAEAARFTTFLAKILGDIRQLLIYDN